jgi:ribosomal protein L24
MGVYRISQLKPGEQATVLSILKENPGVTIKGKNVTSLYEKSKSSIEGELSREVIEGILLSEATPLNA